MSTRRLSRREFLSAVAAASGAALLGACAPPPPEVVKETVIVEGEAVEVTKIVESEKVVTATPAPVEPVTIRHATSIWPALQPVIEESISRFEALHPSVKVKLEGAPGGEHHDKILTLVAGGDAPDVYLVNYHQTVPFIEAGLARSLQPFIAATSFDEDNLPDVMDVARLDGELYGVPCFGGVFSDTNIYYNRDLFDAEGLPYPEWDAKDPDVGWTMDDLLEVAKALTKDTTGDGRIDQWGVHPAIRDYAVAVTIFSNGGSYLSEDETLSAIDTPETIEAVQWMADLVVKHHVAPLPEEVEGLGDTFITGNVAMRYGPVMYNKSVRDAGVDFDWAVADIPRGKAGAINVAVVHPLLMAHSTAYPEESWEWLSYYVGHENQRFVAVWAKALPAQVKSVARSEDYTSFDKPPYDLSPYAYGETRMFPKTDKWLQINNEIIIPALDQVFLADATMEELAPEVSAKINELLAG